jgi:formate dehydrogenase iron-sulfur subunit
MTTATATATAADSVISAFAAVPGGLVPALHAVQHEFGFIDAAHIPLLASTFNISAAEVHGVISFYKDFRTTPPCGTVVQICRAEACQARGANETMAAAKAHVAASHLAVEIEEVFCLGNCALGPSVRVGQRLLAHVGASGVAQLLSEVVAPVGTSSTAPAEPVEVAGVPAVSALGTTPSDTVTVYVPGDSAACSVGADAVAATLAGQAGVRVVRTGTRGLLWLEPLIEVQTATGRVGYGPVHVDDIASLIDSGAFTGADHPLRIGDVEQHDWYRRQQRVTFRRVGVIDPLSVDDFVAHRGFAGLRVALGCTPLDVIATVTESGLRGRGGAAFPTGIKWRTVYDAAATTKYICCNADEGDSGTFADRMLMEGDPLSLIEGMIIAGYAVGASQGYIYIRSEYPDAVAVMQRAIQAATAAGWLGDNIAGSGFGFRCDVRVGAGAYICGEETAMLESIEGRRGEVRPKPPLPAHHGLFAMPTVVNNVLTLATIPMIVADGAAAYAALGFGRSRGTQVFQLAGNIRHGGIFETAFGITLGELITEIGGGTASGRPVRTAQVGGPLGSYLPVSQFDLPMDYETFAAADALVGHGGVVVFDDTVDMAKQARFAMEFCAAESCGKCTPCRIGSTRGIEVIDKITSGRDREQNLQLLEELCEVMTDASLCAMGGLTPLPVRSALAHFEADFVQSPTAASTAAAASSTNGGAR